jgi:hypothetical protein
VRWDGVAWHGIGYVIHATADDEDDDDDDGNGDIGRTQESSNAISRFDTFFFFDTSST